MAKKKKQTILSNITNILMRLSGLAVIFSCFFAWISCLSYNPKDSGINIISDSPIKNILGIYGATTADFIISSFGLALPLFMIPLCLWGRDMLRNRGYYMETNAKLLFFFWSLGLIFASIAFNLLPARWFPFNEAGGLVGHFFSSKLMTVLNTFNTYGYGKYLLFSVCCLLTLWIFDFTLGITLKNWFHWAKISSLAFFAAIAFVCRAIQRFFAFFGNHHYSNEERKEIKQKQEKKRRKAKEEPLERIEPSFSDSGIETAPAIEEKAKEEHFSEQEQPRPIKKTISLKKQEKTEPAEKEISSDDGYIRPSIDLLSRPKDKTNNSISKEELEKIAKELETTLEEFGIHGKIVKVRPGPVVTLYELEPAPGTKSARVIGLADDIARSMSAAAVRIAVVPGSNTIGIELPNHTRDTVWLRDLFEDPTFMESKNALNVVLGKDIGGQNTYADLAKMPHLLVAGTTGSGKSVGVNSMILSLLFRMSPEECKLIMIDPKMLEFSMYNGIPHLLTPVITDPAKAVIGLKWAVKEMEDRYRAMAQMNVRNIGGYNQKVSELKKSGKPYIRTIQTGFDDEGKPIYEEQEMDLKPLPYIVIVVDEMADLMLVAGKEVEAAIQRLAQMARAAGLHLIMSTQRPSVDVITGTIKANFPTRISFQVTSKIDSRTILGEQGAEQLLGKGDMLYMPAGQRPIRIHGAFVKDEEVEGIVEFIKSQKEPEYIEAVTQGELNEKDSGAVFDKGNFSGGGKDEELYAQAVDIVRNDKKASISYVQRRLRIGYNRAASLIDQMEEEGIVSAPDHMGKRQVIG
ncbi:MAG: DNA translocase FtsK 4TM domain-containing protein [Alphaproteobacteria bacterium]|nr:DNA translocase FtsK 4TM domain-containing protein [Alphaproteobacteria bacterium]